MECLLLHLLPCKLDGLFLPPPSSPLPGLLRYQRSGSMSQGSCSAPTTDGRTFSHNWTCPLPSSPPSPAPYSSQASPIIRGADTRGSCSAPTTDGRSQEKARAGSFLRLLQMDQRLPWMAFETSQKKPHRVHFLGSHGWDMLLTWSEGGEVSMKASSGERLSSSMCAAAPARRRSSRPRAAVQARRRPCPSRPHAAVPAPRRPYAARPGPAQLPRPVVARPGPAPLSRPVAARAVPVPAPCRCPGPTPPVNASPRACARVYPSRVHEGIIWFWPNCSPSAAAEAAAAPPPPSLLEFGDPSFRYDTGMADLEYGYEMLMENLLDPAHVPFAHHKYQADRNKAGPLPSMAVTSITARGIEGTSFVGSGLAAVVPPCTLIQKLLIGGKVKLLIGENVPEGSGKKQRTAILFFHCIPPRLPGQSRLIWFFINNIITPWPEGSGKKQRTAILFFHCIPRLPGQSRLIWFFMNNIIPPWVPMPPEWFVHLTRMKVLDTDHPLLHLTEWAAGGGRGGAGGKELLHSHVSRLVRLGLPLRTPLCTLPFFPHQTPLSLPSPLQQEQRLEEEGGAERRLEEEGGAEQGVKSYYTPTSADSFVSAYRSWLLRFAGGKARFPAYVNPELPPAKSRREILDRQRFHVRLCPDCQRVQRWQRFHVRLCPDCQRVQRWSDRLCTALWAASLLLLAATALLPIAPLAIRQAAGPMGAVFAAAAAMVCAAAAHWLKGFIERNYVYEDFVHALWYPAKK
ncbi:unnamed protein product [Closterium sp. NIES-65]|nr:unnamed protein product [Closterium sp. NIES-65]